MREVLAETEAEVIEGGHQRITAVYDYIYPRYNAATADGVVLDVDWWLRIAEDGWSVKLDRKNLMSAMSLRGQKESIRERTNDDTGATKENLGSIRSAKSAIRKHPELVEELLKDPEVHRTLQNAVDSQRPTAADQPAFSGRKDRDWDDVANRAANHIADALAAEERGEWEPDGMIVWKFRCIATLLNRRFLPSADDLVSDIEKFLEMEANR